MVIHKNLDLWWSSSSQQQYPNYNQPQQNQPFAPPPSNYPTYQAQHQPPVALYHPSQFAEWKNTFDMRKENLKTLQSSGRQHRGNMPAKEKESALVAKALNITRCSLQKAINLEIDSVINRYIDKYFQPAIENLKTNLGGDVVGDEQIKSVCRSILEEAKKLYQPNQTRSDCFENDGGSENIQPCIGGFKKDGKSNIEACQYMAKKKAKAPLPRSTKTEALKREAPKWDPERITKETLFVMGSRANRAMGFGPTRGRLYIKHPEVFRYSGDNDDKDWLVRHSLMPPTGQKAFVMIVDDIIELSNSPEYRDSPNLQMHELKGFEAPDFMVQKIKNFMQHMRTDLPGGHRRYKKLNGPQQVDQNPVSTASQNQVSESGQELHTMMLPQNFVPFPCNVQNVNQPMAVTDNLLQQICSQGPAAQHFVNPTSVSNNFTTPADSGQPINFTFLWESSNNQTTHHF